MRHNPVIYEINTAVWLDELSRRSGRRVTLADVPAEALDELAAWGFDAVWMMGVWERSPRGREVALHIPGLLAEYQRALPGFRPEQVIGSPYAVHRYVVDDRFGGRAALAAFREQLARRGMGLLLDYVPNHTAVDHPWTVEHPECLVRGTIQDLAAARGDFFSVRMPDGRERIFAHGRDPYFPAWTDTAQVDAFSPEARAQTWTTLLDIADQCDGVRCDMAMLLVTRIFQRTWGRAETPATEFWSDVISTVRRGHPAFLFMAEVYWDMEAEMQSLGFDYTYDKRLYDRLLRDPAYSLRDHLMAPLDYQQRMVRFIENHDEARALAAFGLEKYRIAAGIALLTPGMTLIHQGQLEGRRVKIPVQLGAGPDEPPVQAVSDFYRALLAEANLPVYHDGTFMNLAAHPTPGSGAVSPPHENLIAFAWAYGDDLRVILANFAWQPVQARVMLPHLSAAGAWRFENALNPGEAMTLPQSAVLCEGLPVQLDAFELKIYRAAHSPP